MRFEASAWAPGRQYLAAVYWALTTMTTVGFGDITPRSDAERAVAMVAVVAGTGFYSYVIGSVSAIVASIDAAQRVQIEKMDLIYSYMRARRFPTELRVKITKYFKLYFEERTALNEEAVLSELDNELREEVRSERARRVARARARPSARVGSRVGARRKARAHLSLSLSPAFPSSSHHPLAPRRETKRSRSSCATRRSRRIGCSAACRRGACSS